MSLVAVRTNLSAAMAGVDQLIAAGGTGGTPTGVTPPAGGGSTPTPTTRPAPVATSKMLRYVASMKCSPVVGGWAYGPLAIRKKPDGTRTLGIGGPQTAAAAGAGNVPSPFVELGDFAAGGVASVVKVWGDIYQGKRMIPGWSGQLQTNGLYWSDPSTLWWTFTELYDVSPGNQLPNVPNSAQEKPCLGCTRFNPDGTTFTAYGPWYIAPPANQHLCHDWIAPLPVWLATATGMTHVMGAGFLSGDGPASWGPPAVAITLPDPTTLPPLSLIPCKILAAYPNLPATSHARRDPFYTTLDHPDQYPPADGSGGPLSGYWTNGDRVKSFCFIDLPGVQGCAWFGRMFGGSAGAPASVWYGDSPVAYNGLTYADPVQSSRGDHSTRYRQALVLGDPGQFAAVAAGKLQPWQVQPTEIVDPAALWPGMACDPHYGITGASQEGTEILCIAPLADRTNPGMPLPLIHCLEVDSSQ